MPIYQSIAYGNSDGRSQLAQNPAGKLCGSVLFQFGKLIGAGGIIMGESVGKYGMGFSYIVLTLLGILFCEMALRQRYASAERVVPKEKTKLI